MTTLLPKSQPDLTYQHYLLMNTALTDTQQPESATSSSSDVAAVNDDWLGQYDRAVWHSEYNCSLHTWLSRGKVRKDKKRWHYRYFLFLEFRDRTGASRYVEYSFDTLEHCLGFQKKQAATVLLPTISPAMTRKKPIPPQLP